MDDSEAECYTPDKVLGYILINKAAAKQKAEEAERKRLKEPMTKVNALFMERLKTMVASTEPLFNIYATELPGISSDDIYQCLKFITDHLNSIGDSPNCRYDLTKNITGVVFIIRVVEIAK
jgi:hypothetical protein